MMTGEYGFKGRKPVAEGQVYTIQITDIGSQGDGIGKVEGMIVFVPDTKVGQEVKVKITKVVRRAAFGDVVDQT
jgi:predicted RNA-binding protein with TRAM domain